MWFINVFLNLTFYMFPGVAVASSVFTITAMSVDRYLAITQSLRQPWMPSRRGACFLLAALWMVALAIFAPLLAVAAVEKENIPLLSRTRNGSVSQFLKRKQLYIFRRRSCRLITKRNEDGCICRRLPTEWDFKLIERIFPRPWTYLVNPIVVPLSGTGLL